MKNDKLAGDNNTITRSPLRFIGSKLMLIQKYRLCEFFPQTCGHHAVVENGKINRHEYSAYVEVFCGSAVLFFNLDPAPRYAILNDINKDIYNFWHVIRYNCDQFMKELEYTWNGDDWVDEYSTRNDDVAKAIVFYINNRRGEFIKGSPTKFYKDFSPWKKKLDDSYTRIWPYDYKKALNIINAPKNKNRGSGSSMLIYIVYEDPPYYGTECVYEHGSFTLKDHYILSKMNHESTSMIFLSYNDCPQVRELYKDWHILELEMFNKRKEETRKELFLSNRPLVRHVKEAENKKTFDPKEW